jgi:hypothetical protein
VGEEHDAQSLSELLRGPLTKRSVPITNPTQKQSVGVPLVAAIKGTAHEANKEQVHSFTFPTHEKIQDVGPQGVVRVACNRQQGWQESRRTLVADPTDGGAA